MVRGSTVMLGAMRPVSMVRSNEPVGPWIFRDCTAVNAMPGTGAIKIVNGCGVLGPPLLNAVTLTLKLPLLPGVPEISPFAVLSVTLAGKVPVTA